MDSKKIEIEELKIDERKTSSWGSAEPQEDDSTRCWGPCPPPAEPPEDQEEVLEIT